MNKKSKEIPAIEAMEGMNKKIEMPDIVKKDGQENDIVLTPNLRIMEYDENGVPYAPAVEIKAAEVVEQNVEPLNDKVMEEENLENKEAMEKPQGKFEIKKLAIAKGAHLKIDRSDVIENAQLMQEVGDFICEPIEYLGMEEVKEYLHDRKLYKIIITSKQADVVPDLKNFEMDFEVIPKNKYDQYEGVIIDGEHRYIALCILKNVDVEPEYREVTIPEIMVIWLGNEGKPWRNDNAANSHLTIDYILEKYREDKYNLAPFFEICSL